MAAYKRAADRGELELRIMFAQDPATFEEVYRNRAQYSHPRINVDCIKIFIDGVLEGQTGAVVSGHK